MSYLAVKERLMMTESEPVNFPLEGERAKSPSVVLPSVEEEGQHIDLMKIKTMAELKGAVIKLCTCTNS